jgi:hypothetical protein
VSYNVEMNPKATHDLATVPQPIRRRIWDGIQALGLDPTGLSKPLTPPLAIGQGYEFSFLHDDMEVWVDAAFQYNSDEQTLHILNIRWEVL